MKKTYEKPTITALDYAQKDCIAACGGFITAMIGTNCNNSAYEDDGYAECDPNTGYNA